ncbi:hypothetical protein HUJ04_011648, partial [Dendroctonus ponderosae]
MVISCVVSGCNNEQDSRQTPFHADNWKPSKTSIICGQHFLSSDYIIKPGLTANLLIPNVVPSVSFP